jgi:hypothetical protein
VFGGKEPAVFFNGLGEIIRSVIPVLILFGFIQWSDQQIAAVMLAVGVFLGFLTTMLTRSQTVPTVTANEQIKVALKEPPSTPVSVVVEKAKEQG